MFDLAVPKAADAKPPYSLLVVIASEGAAGAAVDLAPLTKDGFVVVTPHQKLGGGMWATSEVKDILDFAGQLSGAFSIPPDRHHIVAFTDHRGFDVILICADTPSNDPVELAGVIARDRARVVATGAVGLTFPRKVYYEKEISFINSR